jgi:hypothetical protein
MNDRDPHARPNDRARRVELVVTPNEAIAAVVRDALDEADVEAAYEPAYDRVPAFGVSVGTPVRIRVAEADLERARDALEQARTSGERVDWDAIDVGDAEDPDAAAIAERRQPTDEEWAEAARIRKAKQLRAYGIALIAVAIGCAFAFAGMPAVLWITLALIAVWLGRANAISRRRRQIERLLHADAEADADDRRHSPSD